MPEFLVRLKQSPLGITIRHPRWKYRSRKAKKECVRKAKKCWVCVSGPGLLSRSLEAHHLEPEHVSIAMGRPEMMWSQKNLRPVCRAHHKWVGHPWGWRTWNEAFDETVLALKYAHHTTARRKSL
jgi:hypothetical protein